MTEWQQIAEIPVDSARLAVVDPAYVDDVYAFDADREMTYEVVTNDHGIGVAVLLGTGLGDGVYPVEARFEQAAGRLRIAEVRIRFLPHPVLGYEMPR